MSGKWEGPAVFLEELLPCGGPLFPLRNCNLSPPAGPSVSVFGIGGIELKIYTRFAQIQITLPSLINFFNIRIFSSFEYQGGRDHLTII